MSPLGERSVPKDYRGYVCGFYEDFDRTSASFPDALRTIFCPFDS